jgi:hypothetical protein
LGGLRNFVLVKDSEGAGHKIRHIDCRLAVRGRNELRRPRTIAPYNVASGLCRIGEGTSIHAIGVASIG